MSYYCVYLVISFHIKAKLMKGMHLNRALTSIIAIYDVYVMSNHPLDCLTLLILTFIVIFLF